MRRFTIAPDAVDGGRVTFDADESRHLWRVLRLRPGDTVVATDGRGRDYTVRLDAVGARSTGTVLGEGLVAAESPLAVTLIQSVPKSEKMEAIVRAATELGVERVLPALTERTVVRMDAARWRERARRWQRVAREAAKQSRRPVIPEVEVPRALGEILARPLAGALALCAWEGGGESLAAVLEASARPRSAVILVGPEGGLSGAEADAARSSGFRLVNLGPRILRTETAAPALLAVLQLTFGDLGGR